MYNIIEHQLYVIYSVSGITVENKIKMGLTGKCLQLCLVCGKILNKWYHYYYFYLRELYPSLKILEQARVSQGKGVEEMQASSKHPECASLSKEWLSLQSRDWDF